MGIPSVFVRASLCNLHCIWCDTDYTWNWENTPWKHEKDTDPQYQKFKKEDYLIEINTDEVAEKIAAIPCPRVIITGGEPLLQDEAWQSLIEHLLPKNSDYYFEIETNGTITPSPELDHKIHQYNVSPKLTNSGNSPALRINGKALAFFSNHQKPGSNSSSLVNPILPRSMNSSKSTACPATVSYSCPKAETTQRSKSVASGSLKYAANRASASVIGSIYSFGAVNEVCNFLKTRNFWSIEWFKQSNESHATKPQ